MQSDDFRLHFLFEYIEKNPGGFEETARKKTQMMKKK